MKSRLNRFETFGYEARRFLDGNKKYIIIMTVVFVIALIIGIIIGATTGINSFKKAAVIYGCGKLFGRILIILIPTYIFALFSCANFMFIVLCHGGIAVLGIYFGRASCILIGCLGFCGFINLIIIYIPVIVGSFIFIMIALAYSISEFPIMGCKVWPLLKPVVMSVGLMFILNLIYNAFMIFILGLILDVIVV